MLSVGIFLGFKQMGKRVIPSCLKAVFAVNDSRSIIEVPLSAPELMNTIFLQTSMGMCRVLLSTVSIDTWDKVRKNQTREKAYVITGNIILGIAKTRSIIKRLGCNKYRATLAGMYSGHMITYTDDRGRIRNGYMLSRSYDPKLISLLS